MRWQLGRRSQNIEDRRGDPMARGFPLPRGIPMSRGARRGGLGGLGLIILFLIMLFFGVDPRLLFQGDTTTTPHIPYSEEPGTPPPADDEAAQFVSTVLGYTEDTWAPLFKQMGRTYREPTLVLFSGQVGSACGFAHAAMGPFYCPADEKVYIDLSFYRELRERFGAPGDFAQAYVIAHEVGHHVQNQLGIAEQVQNARQQVDEGQANQLSVMMELQADCLAGVWANHTEQAQQFLERGDIEEGLNAAAAIGDDRIQRQAQGYVVPDAFTHGSSAQRVHWFRAGLESGDMQACDTFNADRF
jgi:predicted metalloprotease